MSAKSTHSVLVKMMNSGEFSDLTLVCQGEEFKVHKVVVCVHSPVIKAAAEGGFEEAQTNVIRMDSFQPATVKRLVQFMYAGDYDAPEMESQAQLHLADDEACSVSRVASVAPVPATSPSQFLAREESGADSDFSEYFPALPQDGAAQLLAHIRMNAIGDYYGIPDLVSLANAKIKHLMGGGLEKTLIEDLPGITETAITSTGDADLQEIFASAIAANISKHTIIDLDEFKNLGIMADFPVKVLKSCAKEFEVLRMKWDSSRTLVQVREEEILRLMSHKARTEKCLEILNRTELCRNINCMTEFQCVIYAGEDVVRCAKCRCRHS